MRASARFGARWLVMLLVSAPALVAGALPAGSKRLEGELVEGKAGVLLLRTTAGVEIVAGEPGTILLGMASVDALFPGDRVRVRWSRSVAGVKLAEVLEADPPWSVQDPTLAVEPGPFASLLAQDGSAPGGLAVDVRPAARFEAGHVPGARRLEPVDARALARLAPDREAKVIFYGEGPRDPKPLAAVQAALAQGYANARVLAGGFAAWKAAQLPVEIEPAGLARAIAARQPFVVIDLRPAERAAQGTIPGAVSMPLSTMDWRDFSGEQWTPPFLLVGENARDPDLAQAAQRLRSWRYHDHGARYDPVWILAGGFEAWSAGGHPVVKGAPLPTRFEPPVDVAAGELPRSEFLAIWAAQGKDGRLLLDVRPAGTDAPAFARHVPLKDLVQALDTLPRDREIVPFCDQGKQSRIAAKLLRQAGFKARYLRGRLPN